jgi:NADP-dependent alcohol dehydrogenase
MNTFYSYNPVKIIHGPGSLGLCLKEIPSSKICFIISKSVRKTKCHLDYLKNIFQNFNYCLINAPQGEPTEAKINLLIKKIKNKKGFFIIGLGGGSVCDFTKAVALFAKNPKKIYKLNNPNLSYLKSPAPFGLISTRPGSGSDSNNAFIISNKINKNSFFASHSFPLFCVQDPKFFQSLNETDFRLGLVDAISHILDQYLVERPTNVVQDKLSEALLISTISLAKEKNKPLLSRLASLSWLSSIISSGILSRGVRTSWLIHSIAHSMGAQTKLPHADCISIIMKELGQIDVFPKEKVAQLSQTLQNDYLTTKSKKNTDKTFLWQTINKIKTYKIITNNEKKKIKKWSANFLKSQNVLENTKAFRLIRGISKI